MIDDVALIRWPDDEARRLRLAREGALRLLLVSGDAPPPRCDDPLEDWVRVPAPDSDVRARAEALRSQARQLRPDVPRIEGSGTLVYRSSQLELSRQQALILEPLIERFGTVVSRRHLASALWPDRPSKIKDLDVPIMRLRRQLNDAGLEIRTVRSRGYLLDARSPEDSPT